jgi:hypothetical protein
VSDIICKSNHPFFTATAAFGWNIVNGYIGCSPYPMLDWCHDNNIIPVEITGYFMIGNFGFTHTLSIDIDNEYDYPSDIYLNTLTIEFQTDTDLTAFLLRWS